MRGGFTVAAQPKRLLPMAPYARIFLILFAASTVDARAQTPPAQSPPAPAGGEACSGCHANSAVVQTPAPRLIGQKPADIVTAMQAFKSGARPATIMDRIAKGFGDAEIEAIAAWYGARKD